MGALTVDEGGLLMFAVCIEDLKCQSVLLSGTDVEQKSTFKSFGGG